MSAIEWQRGSVQFSAMVIGREELQQLYLKHLAYRSAREALGMPIEPIGNSAMNYAKVIRELEILGEFDHFERAVQRLYEIFLSEAQRLDISSNEFDRDDSWARWDLAKQLYFFLDAEAKPNHNYRVANSDVTNPLTDEQMLEEIVDRQVGWAMTRRPEPSWVLAQIGNKARTSPAPTTKPV